MEFSVNSSKKKAIVSTVIYNNPSLLRIRNISWTFLCLAPCLSVFHFLIGYFRPYLYVVNEMFEPEKNLYDLFGHSIFTFCIYVLCFIFLQAFLLNRTLLDLSERDCESISLNRSEIHCLFRMKYCSGPQERVLINIPIDSTRIIYYKKIQKFVFEGNILCFNIEDIDSSASVSDDHITLSEFVLYDYFDPCIYNALLELNVQFEERE